MKTTGSPTSAQLQPRTVDSFLRSQPRVLVTASEIERRFAVDTEFRDLVVQAAFQRQKTKISTWETGRSSIVSVSPRKPSGFEALVRVVGEAITINNRPDVWISDGAVRMPSWVSKSRYATEDIRIRFDKYGDVLDPLFVKQRP